MGSDPGMLKRYWREALASAIFAVAMLALFALAGSFSYSPPYQHHYSEYYATDYQGPKVDGSGVIGRNLDWISAGITALATAAIAWFTFSLRDATKEQGRLTRESIDNAKGASERELRAYCFITSKLPKVRESSVKNSFFKRD